MRESMCLRLLYLLIISTGIVDRLKQEASVIKVMLHGTIFNDDF